MRVELWVALHHDKVKLGNFAVDARVLMVHRPDEAVSDLTDDSVEAEEQVTLEVLMEVLLRHRYVVEAEVKRC